MIRSRVRTAIDTPGTTEKMLTRAIVFLSAFLLFQVQPMIAKIILPWFGGSAAVWTTCLCFFQVDLRWAIYTRMPLRVIYPEGGSFWFIVGF